jgi:hypothetical protein
MTALEALAILEAATLECKKREADTAELRAGLDFLEPHIQPAWLIAQFRHNRDGDGNTSMLRGKVNNKYFALRFPVSEIQSER